MQGNLKFKSRNCIEWEITGMCSYFQSDWVSEKFKLKDVTCSLRYVFNSSTLYLISSVPITPSVDVMVHDLLRNNSENFQKTLFTGKNQYIWSDPYLVGSSSTLQLEIIILADILQESGTGSITGKNEIEDGAPSSYLGKDIHFHALSKDISKVLGDTSSCDVKITCDGKTLHAHKIVLGTRSSVFSRMLKSDMVEGKKGLVNVDDIEYSIFESFLKYIYSGMLPKLSMENAVALYKVGDKYDVQNLKLACSEYLTKNLSESNACDILVLADLHSDKNFREKVISYIVDQRIPQRYNNWSAFCKCHCDLANEVLNLYMKKHCPM